MPRKIRELKADLRTEAEMTEGEEVRKYSMLIEWSDEDDAYIVTVPELPGCRTHGATHIEAIQQGEDAIESWIDAARAWGNPIPKPRVFAPSPAISA